jgi:hypothetical protein
MITHNKLPNIVGWKDEFMEMNPKREHPGQIKMLLVEILFLCKYSKLSPDIVVYVGSGPGLHIPLLMSMFPKLYFNLYDCRFDNRLKVMEKVPGAKVKLFIKYFTQEDCAQYVNKKILFMSDIRDLTMKGEGIDVQNAIVEKNQNMQWNWIKEMKPMFSMLKFRLPFKSESFEYEYCDGEIITQPYTSPWSAESRLIIKDPMKSKMYNNLEYENRFVFLNFIMKYCLIFNYKESAEPLSYNDIYKYYIINMYYEVMLNKKNVSFVELKKFIDKINKSIYG